MNPLASFLDDLPDPRPKHLVDHPLLAILTIVILSTFYGAEGWKEMVRWAHSKQTCLATLVDLRHWLPSADTLRRVTAALLSGPFRRAFVAWAQALVESTHGKLIAVDGKTGVRPEQAMTRRIDRWTLGAA